MAKKAYPDVNSNPDFPQLEEAVLNYWDKEQVFQQSIDSRPAQKEGKNNEFIFYDGPPFANGLPHYGHLLTGFVKDVIARYQTMQGKRVERRFGWDCHGLPAEMGSEKELGISGRAVITNFGIGKFNEHCRTSVMKYTHEWEYYVTRQARWVDFKSDYKTMDINFMESVLWAFKQLYDKGLVYEAHRVMPYSWAAETPLSNFETKLDNSYREREDKAITVAFELNTPPHGAPQGCKAYKVLAWTTTPWTLPSNLALAVNRNIQYGYIHRGDSCYLMAASALAAYEKELAFVPGSAAPSYETERCLLRPFTEKDLDLLSGLHNSPPVAATTIDGAQTLQQVKEHLDAFIKQQNERGFGQWAVFDKATHEFIGRCGFVVRALDPSQPPQIELRYAYHEKYWGKGLATEVGNFWLQWGFTHLNPAKIVAGLMPHGTQPERVKVLTKLGLKHAKDVDINGSKGPYFAIARQEFWDLHGLPGERLLGLSYHPLFPYFAAHRHAFKILDGSSFVTDADGTGIVHMAPGFGEDDQRVCEANGIELVVPVDGQGKYTDEIYDLPIPRQVEGVSGELRLKGLNVIAEPGGSKFGLANDRIIDYLKATGQLIKQETIKHNYPHCWRTDTPLIYRAMPSWYVEVTKFRDRAVEINKEIHWIPEHVRDGQMGHMLATAPDWSISRNRFWGTPIPVWRSKSGKIKVFGSIAEIEAASGQKVKDLHRPYIDELVVKDGGEEYRRVEDVFDCWFESGSMPFAQVHYPFENKEWFETHFPADFITEYVGQTRGWFNTLIMLSTALFDKAPFMHCICHGVVLDSETGLKYSKRLKNYKDPKEVMDKFGADALRWLMLASPVMRGMDLMVDPEGKFIRDVVRLAIKPIWNAYNFFCLYANADGIVARSEEQGTSTINDSCPSPLVTNVMDRYILAKCRQAVEQIEKSFDAYDTPGACEAVTQFFEALNNWYIRRNKERFWKHEHDADKQAAYDTLYTVLTTMCRAAAPLLPLTLEEIYRGLTGEVSVHLASFPPVIPVQAGIHAKPLANSNVDPGLRRDDDEDTLVEEMDRVRDICTSALSIRNQQNIRVRQPLKKLDIAGYRLDKLYKYTDIIKDELNVKEVVFHHSEEMANYGIFKLQIIFPELGKRLKAEGKENKMKEITAAAKNNQWVKNQAGQRIVAGEILVTGEYKQLLEPKKEYTKNSAALSTNDAIVVLDLEVTPELEAEGIARDLVRMVQQARKDASLNVSDRIRLHIGAPEGIAKAVAAHRDYLMEQTLSVELSDKKLTSPAFSAENTLDDQRVTISFSVAA